MIKATLVLEGGANRGVFTSGVLDYLMGKELYMSNVIGVSAGACNAVDYVSKQAGRSRECVIHREKEYDYVYGLKKTLKEKALMDMDMLFDKFPNEIYPFDFETYFASEMECELVVTNCITGAAEYLSEDNRDTITLNEMMCSVENLDPHKLYEPVKVSENNFA